MDALPVRFISPRDEAERRPVYAVWELTLKCNLKCQHCGSRAGAQREDELSTSEALALVDDLASLGVRELALIGGEAYLRGDWLDIVAKAHAKGIRCALQTGGYGLGETLLARAKRAGLAAVGVSIDGTQAVHDAIRGVPGSHKAAFQTLATARAIGLPVTANTQIHAGNRHDLLDIFEHLAAAGIKSWQIQLTVAMGNAVENAGLLLQPYMLDDIFPVLAQLADECSRRGIILLPGNNVGYFGPYEHLWRGPSQSAGHYEGCRAGMNALGLEADGTLKGCPSLATSRFAEGNVRHTPLQTLWHDEQHFRLNRQGTGLLWGFCETCYYAPICRGGCAWTSDSLLGKPGNNPYCHHRVLELKRRGLRERIEKVEEASGQSFGVGLFRLVEEPWQNDCATA